jgi:hypothetical protein
MKSSSLVLALIVSLALVGVAPIWAADTAETKPAAEGTEKTPVIQIQEAVVCQEVAERKPVKAGDVFAKDCGLLYCYTHVTGAVRDTQITHNWYYQGTLKFSMQLPVRGANWRTWSKKNINPEWTGEWMVEILSENGVPLQSVVFQIK